MKGLYALAAAQQYRPPSSYTRRDTLLRFQSSHGQVDDDSQLSVETLTHCLTTLSEEHPPELETVTSAGRKLDAPSTR